jgi:hypothetical protein
MGNSSQNWNNYKNHLMSMRNSNPHYQNSMEKLNRQTMSYKHTSDRIGRSMRMDDAPMSSRLDFGLKSSQEWNRFSNETISEGLGRDQERRDQLDLKIGEAEFQRSEVMRAEKKEREEKRSQVWKNVISGTGLALDIASKFVPGGQLIPFGTFQALTSMTNALCFSGHTSSEEMFGYMREGIGLAIDGFTKYSQDVKLKGYAEDHREVFRQLQQLESEGVHLNSFEYQQLMSFPPDELHKYLSDGSLEELIYKSGRNRLESSKKQYGYISENYSDYSSHLQESLDNFHNLSYKQKEHLSNLLSSENQSLESRYSLRNQISFIRGLPESYSSVLSEDILSPYFSNGELKKDISDGDISILKEFLSNEGSRYSTVEDKLQSHITSDIKRTIHEYDIPSQKGLNSWLHYLVSGDLDLSSANLEKVIKNWLEIHGIKKYSSNNKGTK